MLDNETKRRIDTARDILVGKVPDPKSQVEQITIALIYKFMDDMDAESEELGGKRKFFSGDFERYDWKKLMAPSLGSFEVLNLYAEAIQKMNINPNIPQLFRDIFKNAYLPYRDPETLKSFLKIIDDFEYDHSERLGDAFEYLLSVLGSQGDAGQFRTPRHIIDFMVEIIAPKKNETILDPACGTAGFLISSYKHIIKHNSSNFIPEAEKESFEQIAPSVAELTSSSIAKYKGDKLTPDERKKLAQNIKGYDISPDMVRLSLVNLYLHGFNDPKIFEYDTLTSEDNWNKYADVILANPPFMSPKGGIKPHKRFSIPSNRSEVLFVDYMVEHLTPNGRSAIIVPEGIIFQSGTAYKQLRRMLVENYLFAVVSLPAGVFNPYSGVKTSILLIDKVLNKKTKQILFAKIESDGFDLGAQRRPNKKSELPYAVKAIKNYVNSVINGTDFNLEDHNNLVIATKEKIAKNEYWNLSSERYKDKKIDLSSYSLFRLEDIFNEIRNGSDVNQFDEIGKYRVTRIQTISDGTVNLEKTKYTNDEVQPDKFMEAGDILLSHINSIEHLAKSAIFPKIDEKVVHDINLLRFRPNKNLVEPLFAAYIFKSEQFIEKAKSFAQKAVNQASIKSSDLKQIQIPLPPLDIQKEIIVELEGYQKIIDGARQVVENYKPQIQIDPSWPMVELSEICDVRDGTHDSPKYQDIGYPLVTSKNIKDGKIDFSDVNFISRDDLDKINQRSLVEDGDIIMPMIGTIGNPIIVKKEREFAIKNVALIKFYNDSKINSYYLKTLLDSDYFRTHFANYSSGSTQKFVSLGFIRKLVIPVPSIETQEEIAKRIANEVLIIEKNKELITIFEQKIKDKIARVWGE